MSLNAKKVPQNPDAAPKHRQSPIEPGSYPARIVQIIDLGVQNQRPFRNEPKPPVHQITVTYELVDEFCYDDEGKILEDKPRWLSEDFPFYSLQAERAKSTKRYLAIDPEDKYDGDFTKLLGQPCMVTVTKRDGTGQHEGKTFNNVGDVSTMRAKQQESCPALVNDPKLFVMDEPDLEVFRSLPDWLQEKLKDNLNYEGSALQAAFSGKSQEPQFSEDEAAPENPPEVGTKQAGKTSTDEVEW